MTPEKRKEWEMLLNEPLPGETRSASPLTIEQEGQSFMDAMALNAKMGG